MMRAILVLVVSAIASGSAVYLLTGGTVERGAEPPSARPSLAASLDPAAPASLEPRISRLAREPRSIGRDAELSALLVRFAELDRERAARFAGSLDLESRFVEPLYRLWAEADASAAISQLAGIREPAMRRALALAVLAAVGDDEGGIARVAAGLPAADRFAFEVDALAARAEHDLVGALEIAAAKEGAMVETLILSRIAETAARRDPLGALALAATIDEAAMRRTFTASLLTAWARLDPVRVLAYLEAAPSSDVPNSTELFAAIAVGDPEPLLERLERFPPDTRLTARRAALEALAEHDPLAALARVEELPSGRDRENLLQTVTETYGRQDPTAALAWALSRQPPSQSALNGAVAGVASVDLNAAIDWIMREIESPSVTGLSAAQAFPTAALFRGIHAATLDVAATVDRLLGTADPALKARAAGMLAVWSQTNAEGAVSVALGRLERLAPADLSALAQQAAVSAPEVAMRTAERLPPEHRATWVASVADALARSSPERARAFLAEQRDEPGYEQGVVAVVRRLAPVDPPAAAALLATVEPSPQMQSAALSVAAAWGRENPTAAADWAVELGQPRPIGAVATAWAREDSRAAERWALGLQSAGMRDAGIMGVLSAAAESGELDPALLSALSSDKARQQGAGRLILQIARTDQARARVLLDTYLSDPALRRQIEAQLAGIGAAGGASLPLPRFLIPQ